MHQSKIFKDLNEFVEAMKNLDNENVLIVAEELEYASYDKNEDQQKETFDRIKNRMILVSQSGRSDSTDFNHLVNSSTFKIVFYLDHIYGSIVSGCRAKTEKLHRTGDAFAVDTIRNTVTRLEMITES